MLDVLFDARHRVLLVRFSATVEEADVARHRRLRLRFSQSEGEVPVIIDLSGIERVALPTARIRAAGVNAASHLGRSRVVVAQPGSAAFGLARLFITVRDDSGHAAPDLVASMQDALRLLKLDDPEFAPWPAD